MRYYKASQRKSDGRWDFTCRYDSNVYPTGYCTQFRPLDAKIYPFTEQENAKHEALKDNYHATGHATEEEACECYKKYLLDTTLRLDCKSETEQHRCEACGVWTQQMAIVDGTHYFDLCPEHLTREVVEELYKAPGEIWSS